MQEEKELQRPPPCAETAKEVSYVVCSVTLHTVVAGYEVPEQRRFPAPVAILA